MNSILSTIVVLALVGGRAVTDRDIKIDLVLDDPSSFEQVLSLNAKSEQIEKGLQNYMTQMMVVEESKVLGTNPVPRDAPQSELMKLKKELGPVKWQKFVGSFDLSESSLRTRLENRLIVDEALNSRTRSAVYGITDPAKKEAAARKSLGEWLGQLRSRYRVQYMQKQNESATNSL